MTTKEIHFASIDDMLGSREKRFFGVGFRKVHHELKEIRVGERWVEAQASVMYPSDWSKKSENEELRPHLSSIDALVLSIQLNEIYLIHRFGLDEQEREKMWLRRFVMKAGSTPQENLSQFDVRSEHLETKSSPDARGGHLSIFEAQIGTIKVDCEIEHGLGEENAQSGFYPTGDEILGTPDGRYYGNGYRYPIQRIENVAIDIDKQSAKSMVTIEQTDAEQKQGIEGFYRPSVSMIDCMTIIAQLGQALLYQLDNIHRSESNTLWMKKIVMESKRPDQAYDAFAASTHIIKSKLLKVRGGTWRSSDMFGQCQGIHVHYTVAHELPTPDLSSDSK